MLSNTDRRAAVLPDAQQIDHVPTTCVVHYIAAFSGEATFEKQCPKQHLLSRENSAGN
jgi:hypothetical protein